MCLSLLAAHCATWSITSWASRTGWQIPPTQLTHRHIATLQPPSTFTAFSSAPSEAWTISTSSPPAPSSSSHRPHPPSTPLSLETNSPAPLPPLRPQLPLSNTLLNPSHFLSPSPSRWTHSILAVETIVTSRTFSSGTSWPRGPKRGVPMEVDRMMARILRVCVLNEANVEQVQGIWGMGLMILVPLAEGLVLVGRSRTGLEMRKSWRGSRYTRPRRLSRASGPNGRRGKWERRI